MAGKQSKQEKTTKKEKTPKKEQSADQAIKMIQKDMPESSQFSSAIVAQYEGEPKSDMHIMAPERLKRRFNAAVAAQYGSRHNSDVFIILMEQFALAYEKKQHTKAD